MVVASHAPQVTYQKACIYVMGLHKWTSCNAYNRSVCCTTDIYGYRIKVDCENVAKQPAAHQIEERHANSSHIPAAGSLGNYTSVTRCSCSASTSDEYRKKINVQITNEEISTKVWDKLCPRLSAHAQLIRFALQRLVHNLDYLSPCLCVVTFLCMPVCQ